MKRLYAHMVSKGDMFGRDVRTPLTWEVSSRHRPTSTYSYELDAIKAKEFLLARLHGKQMCATYTELKSFIK